MEASLQNQFYNFAKIAKLTYFVDKCNRDNYEFMYFIRTNIHNEQWPGKSNLIQDIRNSKVKSVSQLSGFQWSPDELFDTNYKERIFTDVIFCFLFNLENEDHVEKCLKLIRKQHLRMLFPSTPI